MKFTQIGRLGPMGVQGFWKRAEPPRDTYAYMRTLNPGIGRNFLHSTGMFTAVGGALNDDGGTQIETRNPGVQWVRDGIYNTAVNPMQLAWFEAERNGSLIGASDDVSYAIQTLSNARFDVPYALPFQYTAETVGMWLFDGALSEMSQEPYVPEEIWLSNTVPVVVSDMLFDYGQIAVVWEGPIEFVDFAGVLAPMEVDTYVPRRKLIRFDPRVYSFGVAHDFSVSTESLGIPTTAGYDLDIDATCVGDLRMRWSAGKAVEQVVIAKRGASHASLAWTTQDQSKLPVQFLPEEPWQKFVDAPHDAALIPGDALVLDALLSRFVFQSTVLDVEPDTNATRVFYVDNWDVSVNPFLSFWYRATANLTLELSIRCWVDPVFEYTTGTQGQWLFNERLFEYIEAPIERVVPWAATCNDTWQQADIDMSVVVAALGLGTRIGSFVISITNSGGDGYYRLAGWE